MFKFAGSCAESMFRMSNKPLLAPNDGDVVDLRPLKALALSMLPPSSGARLVITSLPDSLPRRDAESKVEVILILVHSELGGK